MLHIVKHPLIETKLNMMRDKNTSCKDFRNLLDEISSLMTYEVFKDVELVSLNEKIETPTGCVVDKVKLAYDPVIVPILRAGIGMSQGVCNMLPAAKIGHIGLYRDEKTLKPVEYFCKLPNVNNPLVVLCDPMLATGGSASEAIKIVKQHKPKSISFVCLVAAPEGLERLKKEHPDIDIYIASLDEKLNDKCYIVPGLGDAGDRIFGTK